MRDVLPPKAGYQIVKVWSNPERRQMADWGYIPQPGIRARRRFWQAKQLRWQRESLIAALEARAGTGRAVGVFFYKAVAA